MAITLAKIAPGYYHVRIVAQQSIPKTFVWLYSSAEFVVIHIALKAIDALLV